MKRGEGIEKYKEKKKSKIMMEEGIGVRGLQAK